MSVISFWSQSKKETGKTSAVIALATHMAIEHNYKILVVSTSLNDNTIQNAFWEEPKTKGKSKTNLGLFGPNTNAVMQNGIEGLNRYVRSNKASAEVITNYTKVVFKNRLEILLGYTGDKNSFAEVQSSYPSILQLADQYYDIVLVDISSKLDSNIQQEILHISDIVVISMKQRLESINKFLEEKEKSELLNSPKTLLLLGRYDRFSKYTSKNVTRYLREKNEVNTIPYNTLFFEACEEGNIPDLFLRLRKINDETDSNVFFLKEIKRLSDNIIYRLQDIQMRRR